MHSTVRETVETEVQGRLEDYGDLIVQNIGTFLKIPAANLPNAEPADAIVNTHDVMGDVDRYGADEAVLLAQDLRCLEAALPGTYSAETDIEFWYELSFNSNRSEAEYLEDGNFANAAYGTSSNRYDRSEVGNDVLYWTWGHTFAQYADSSTGTGGGGDSFRIEDEKNYVHEVGVMPEVSARENLNEHLKIENRNSATPEDGVFTFNTSWQLYWLETDDEIEGRQIDITD